MAQASVARRAAEQAARQRLAGPLIGAVGELGVAVAERDSALAAVPAAKERAHEHVRRAQREAEEMVAAAAAEVTAAHERYRCAFLAAAEAGWAPRALTDMGYPAPDRSTGTRPRRSRANTSRSAAAPTSAALSKEAGDPGPTQDAREPGAAGGGARPDMAPDYPAPRLPARLPTARAVPRVLTGENR